MLRMTLLTILVLAVAAVTVLVQVRPDDSFVYRRLDNDSLHLHVYGEPDEGTPKPALVLFHGGSWRHGSPCGRGTGPPGRRCGAGA